MMMIIQLEFTGKKNVYILSSGLNRYRVSVILLQLENVLNYPLLVLKEESWKTIEKELRGLSFVRDRSIFINCQREPQVHFVYFQRMDKRNIHSL